MITPATVLLALALWLFFATVVSYIADKNSGFVFGHAFNLQMAVSMLGALVGSLFSDTGMIVGAFFGLVASWGLMAWLQER